MANTDTSKVRFGILGCARIARKICRAILLSPSAELRAIGSRSVEKAKAFASANNAPEGVSLYDSYDKVVDDPSVDAVYIPLPTSLHLEWALKAASKKKHILIEKPPALSVQDLDSIIKACDFNGVQLMDGTMWMHHPRTRAMAPFLSDAERFGQVNEVHSTFTYRADEGFLKGNIRVKPDMDALGALGDIGWYCIRGILWAYSYEMPAKVTALPGYVTNEAGVILACSAHLLWEDGRVATFHCSFYSDMCMDLTVNGTKGVLRVHDFVIPYEENSAGFVTSSNVTLSGVHIGWDPKPTEHIVTSELPQEVLMIHELSRLAKGIRDDRAKPNPYWPSLTRKTQQIINAVETSIKNGLVSITIEP